MEERKCKFAKFKVFRVLKKKMVLEKEKEIIRVYI